MGLWENTAAVNWNEAECWGITKSGVKVGKGEALFPRIDIKTLGEDSTIAGGTDQPAEAEVPGTSQEQKNGDQFITIDEFARMDLRVAEVVACEKMKKADKLLILTLKVGEEERTVVSGIAQHYTPEELVGKKVVLVANLKPTKLRGVMSHGMILAASDDKYVDVLTVTKDIASGQRVK